MDSVVTPGANERPTNPRLDGIAVLALTAIATAVWSPLLRWKVMLGDEGWLATGVERLLDGEALYHDFFRSYAPGVYWGYVPFFQLFGESIPVMRGVALAQLVIVAVLVYSITLPVMPRWAAFASALFPILVRAPLHKMFVPLSVMLGLWLCRLLVAGGGGSRRTWIVGIGLGLVGLLRQEVAAYSVLIAAVSIVATELCRIDGSAPRTSAPRAIASRLVMLAGGIAMVWVPAAILLTSSGSIGEVVDQLVLSGLRANAAMEVPFPALGDVLAGPEKLKTSLYFLPMIAAIGTALVIAGAVARKRCRPHHVILFQWAAMALLTHSVFLSRADFPHLKQALPVTFILLAYLAGTLWRTGGSRVIGRSLALAIGVWFVGLLVWSSRSEILPAYRGLAEGVPLDEPRASLVLPERQAQAIQEVLEQVRKRTDAGEPVFFAPHISLFYFLSERSNPTRHDSVWPGFASDPEIQQEIIADLESSQVKLIVYKQGAKNGDEANRFPDYAPELERYLQENFRVVSEPRGYAVCERGEPGQKRRPEVPRPGKRRPPKRRKR